MPDQEHLHKWTVLRAPDKLQCTSCQTVTDIKTLMHNVAKEAARAMKVELYVAQLYARDLKKPAHERVYAWVIQNSPSIVIPIVESKQETLV